MILREPSGCQDGTGTLDLTLGSSNPPGKQRSGPCDSTSPGGPQEHLLLAWGSPMGPGRVEEPPPWLDCPPRERPPSLVAETPESAISQVGLHFCAPGWKYPPGSLSWLGHKQKQPTPGLQD